jgi:large subunit ribosomal protein L3
MKFMLGTKGRMTQIFDDKGVVTPATIVNAGTLTITQVKTKETKDGYAAVQLGFGTRKEKNVSKPVLGHLKDLPIARFIREYRGDTGEMKRGETVDLSVFAEGDVVEVSAISKAKGFQGVVKRHGFSGGPRSHGQKNKERAPGSLGGGARAGARVAKGMRMAGRMGGDRITVKNLRVLQIDKEAGTILISGAIPGHPGTLVEIRG